MELGAMLHIGMYEKFQATGEAKNNPKTALKKGKKLPLEGKIGRKMNRIDKYDPVLAIDAANEWN